MDQQLGAPDDQLLKLLVCPRTRTRLHYDPVANLLVSEEAKLAYPIRDGIPILLADEACPWESRPGG